MLRTLLLHLTVVAAIALAMEGMINENGGRLRSVTVVRRPVNEHEGVQERESQQFNDRRGPQVQIQAREQQRPSRFQQQAQDQQSFARQQQRAGQGPSPNRPSPPNRPPPPTKPPVVTTTMEDTSGRLLELPDPHLCATRPSHFELDGHHYFYSDRLPEHKMKKYDWLMGRNICRKYCMDLVSIETPSEDDMIVEFLRKDDIPYIWTSGRLCNFDGCEIRNDLKPYIINGWFWSGSSIKMAPTNSTPPGWPYQPWSDTGHKTKLMGHKVPQPDNAEFDINQSVEACMGILNDIYEDGIKWHDIACYHTKPLLCEDSDKLLEWARKTNKDLDIY